MQAVSAIMSKSELKRLNVQAGVAIDQPQWVCLLCGNKHGRRPMNMHSERISTWHIGTCGICGKDTEVTEPRDFGYLYAGQATHDSDRMAEDNERKET